jgi:hypothetical protein
MTYWGVEVKIYTFLTLELDVNVFSHSRWGCLPQCKEPTLSTGWEAESFRDRNKRDGEGKRSWCYREANPDNAAHSQSLCGLNSPTHSVNYIENYYS